MFTNPEGDSAGRLIDAGGLQGLPPRDGARVGEARQLHSGRQGGPADDVRRVMDAVRAEVRAATGIELSTEVRMVGFGDDPRIGSRGREVTPAGATAARPSTRGSASGVSRSNGAGPRSGCGGQAVAAGAVGLVVVGVLPAPHPALRGQGP